MITLNTIELGILRVGAQHLLGFHYHSEINQKSLRELISKLDEMIQEQNEMEYTQGKIRTKT